MIKRAGISLICAALPLAFAAAGSSNDWAVEVVEYVPTNPAYGYTNATVALGEAARTTPGSFGATGDVPVNVCEPPWSKSQIVSIGDNGWLTLKMGEDVFDDDDPLHPFGVDLIVYGNALFGVPPDAPDYYSSPWVAIWTDPAEIWVSADTTSWFRADGRYADALMPTQSIDINGKPSDYLYPVDPSLLTNDWFDGTWMYTNTVIAYEGAGGGAPVDLSFLVDAGDNPTNLAWIRYVKFIDIEGDNKQTEIDAVARVRDVPEPAPFGAAILCVAAARARKRKK